MTQESHKSWSIFSEHLDRALDLPPAELEIWLGSLHQSNPDLARQIENALRGRDAAAFPDFLSSPSPLLGEAAALTTLMGRRVGPYVVEAQIGHGGMGSVWRARRDDGQYDAVVAIKFIHASWIGKAGEQRFRLEGNMLGRLVHPNIARLLDAGVFDSAQPYLVLEYVEGESIDAYCQRHLLDAGERVRLYLHALAAVAHAHSHLIIHRDIKPSNILVAHDGSVKLLDFGVAKLLSEQAGDTPLTRSSAAALTPQYAAPEQLSGQAVTTATDVYSLGVVLHLLLTGAHPFQAATKRPLELIRAVMSTPAPRASDTAQLATVPAGALQGDLDNILHKALKKDPAERYATVGAFADDLQRHLTNQPVTAAPDTLAYRASKFVRRNRGAVAGTAAAALGLLVTTSATLWQTHEARLERDAALAAQRRADAVSEFTSLLLRDIGPAETPNVLRKQLDHARLLLHEQHYKDPLINAHLLRQLAARYWEAGATADSIELFEEGLVAASKANEPLSLAQMHCSLANMYEGLGRIEESDRHIHAAILTMERLGDEVRPEDRADCRVVESYVASAHRENRRAIEAARTALTEIENAGIRSGDQHVTELNALRRAYAHAGLYEKALQMDRAIMAEDASTQSSHSIWVWIHAFNAADTLLGGGRVRDAEARSAALLATSDRFNDSGDNSRDIALLHARILLALDRPAEARPLLDRARQLSGSNPDIDLAVTLTQAQERLQAGDLAAAAQSLDANQRQIQQAIGSRVDDGLFALRLRAMLALRLHQLTAAEAAAAQAMALAVDADGERTQEYLESAALRSEIAVAQGQPQLALGFANQALAQARRQAAIPASSASIGRCLLLRSRSAQAMGQGASAHDDAMAALTHLQTNLGAQHPLTQQAQALALADTL